MVSPNKSPVEKARDKVVEHLEANYPAFKTVVKKLTSSEKYKHGRRFAFSRMYSDKHLYVLYQVCFTCTKPPLPPPFPSPAQAAAVPAMPVKKNKPTKTGKRVTRSQTKAKISKRA